jgi:hypothetical protein
MFIKIRIIFVKFTLLMAASMVIFGCATKRIYHGVESTDLSGLYYGMKLDDVEAILGSAERELQCDSGRIITYAYDRGYAGCLKDGTCIQSESAHLKGEIMVDVLTFGIFSVIWPQCLNTCQRGHLELYFDRDNELIGARERATDRDNFCWRKRNSPDVADPFERGFCSRVFTYRRPSSVSEILKLNTLDLPDNKCDIFEQ